MELRDPLDFVNAVTSKRDDEISLKTLHAREASLNSVDTKEYTQSSSA